MGQHQSAKASSAKAPDRLEIYKAVLDFAFAWAHLSDAPSYGDLLEVLLGRAKKPTSPYGGLTLGPRVR